MAKVKSLWYDPAMKKSIFSYSLFLVLALNLLGCARDTEAVSKEKRAEIQARNSGGRSSGGRNFQNRTSGATVKLGTFALTSFMGEKHGEVIALFMSSLLEQGQSGFEGKIDFSTDPAQSVVAKRFIINRTTNLHSEYIQKRQAVWDAQVFSSLVEDKKQVSFVNATTSLSKVTVDLAQKTADRSKRKFVNFFEDSAELKAYRKNNSGLYDIEFSSKGELVISKDGVMEKVPYTLSLNLSAEISSLDQEKVEVLNSRGFLNIVRSDRPLKVEVSTRKSLVFYNTKCGYVGGEIKTYPTSSRDDSKKPVPAKVFKFDDEKVVLEESSWKVPVATCEERPLTDYSRILVY